MTFDDILSLPDKTVIAELRGRVVKVNEPRRPTERQEKAGIYPQTIILQNDAGTNLTLYLMRKALHFLPSSETHIWHFRSTTGDKGKEYGLAMNRWKGTNDTEETVCVQVDTDAHFYQVDEAPAERKAFMDSMPKVADLIANYVGIIQGMETAFGGSQVWEAMLSHPEALTSAAATIFIEGAKQGMFKKVPLITPDAPKPTDQRNSDPDPKSNAQGPQEDPKSNAEIVAEALVDHPEFTIASVVVGGTSKDSLKRLMEKIDRPDMGRVYDEIFKILVGQGHKPDYIDACHNRVKKKIAQKIGHAPNDSELYTSIVYNFSAFMENLKLLEEKDAPEVNQSNDSDVTQVLSRKDREAALKATDDDDAGLPILD